MESVADAQRNIPSWDSILEMMYETHQMIRESVEQHNVERGEYERRNREYDEQRKAEREEYERRNREYDEQRKAEREEYDRRNRESDERRMAEEEKRRAEEEKRRRAEDERRRAEEEKRRVEDERRRAEEEKRIAEEEKRRAEEEKRRRADEEKRKADWEELRLQMKETDRKFKELATKYSSQTGHIVEGLMEPSALRLFQQSGFDIDKCWKEMKGKRKSSGNAMEVDLFLHDTTDAVAVEVKTNCTEADVDRFLAQMEKFGDVFPEFADVNVYVAIAAINYNRGADKYAAQKGLFVIRVGEDAFTLDPAQRSDMTFFYQGRKCGKNKA